MTKPIPDLSSVRELCCGCAACYSICPVSAITMEPDDKGFLYPIINDNICVQCYQCWNVCAFKKDYADKFGKRGFGAE